jgi:glutamate/tyrosine decarboxylase-like PLP-dependent enzyme
MKLGGAMQGAVIYSSDQAHSSNWKNIRILGFQFEQIRLVPVDEHLRLDVAALAKAVDEDRRSGRRPFCVIATAGTTNTGAVDPLNAIADVCDQQDLWLHVDGAYGAAAVLTERGRTLLSGMERAHSLVLDPHKWLFQPFDIGCCLVRDVRWLEESFSTSRCRVARAELGGQSMMAMFPGSAGRRWRRSSLGGMP